MAIWTKEEEPVVDVLRRLKERGVLTDWFQHQTGDNVGTWDLTGPDVRVRAESFDFVRGFTTAASIGSLTR